MGYGGGKVTASTLLADRKTPGKPAPGQNPEEKPRNPTEKPAPWLIFRNPKTRSRPWISLREARSVAGHRCRVVIWTMEVASSSNRGVFWFHASRQGVRIAEMR